MPGIDELFELPFPFAAVSDVYGSGFKLQFNAGVLALHPSNDIFDSLYARFADAMYNPHEAEQSFLNVYFGADAVRLPYVYNANLAIRSGMPCATSCASCIYTVPKPFPKVGTGIADGAHLERAIYETRRDRGGVHAEAVDWWVNDFRAQNRVTLRWSSVKLRRYRIHPNGLHITPCNSVPPS